MARRCYLIANPTSGSYSQRKIDRITATLSSSGIEPVLLLTGNEMDPTLFASRVCAAEDDPFIAVVGGDGTVNAVLNGLAPGKATLAVIPSGTANVLARELGIRNLDDAVKRVAAGSSRAVPVGEMDCSGYKKRFLLMAGVGLDGAVVQGVRLSEKRKYGKGAYLLSALRVFSDWDGEQLRVYGAGNELLCHSVIVCNAAKYGGNFRLAAEADLFTPGFQVFCISGGRFTYMRLALLLVFGRVAADPSVTSFPAAELEVIGRKAVQLDGDHFGSAPLIIRSIPDFVRLIV